MENLVSNKGDYLKGFEMEGREWRKKLRYERIDGTYLRHILSAVPY